MGGLPCFETTWTARVATAVWPAGLMVKASVSGGYHLAEDSGFESPVGRFLVDVPTH